MSHHSVANATNHLSDLIDRTLAGEDVVVIRHGHPGVSLQAVRPEVEPVTRADLSWLAAHRVRAPIGTDAGTLVSRIRDEDER
jgi:antitoxin (DNA-binding transcriptional repressor) of toxin-antitoxin stability system